MKAVPSSPVFHEETLCSRQPAKKKHAARVLTRCIFPTPPSLDYPHAIPLPGEDKRHGRRLHPRNMARKQKTPAAQAHKAMGRQKNRAARFPRSRKTHPIQTRSPTGHRVRSATQRNGSPCTRLALKGMNVCEAHGGCGLLAIQGKLQPTGRAKARIAAQLTASKDQGPPPIELTKLPLYRQANDWTRIRLARAFKIPQGLASLTDRPTNQ